MFTSLQAKVLLLISMYVRVYCVIDIANYNNERGI